MKRTILVILCVFSNLSIAQIVDIPDPFFKGLMLGTWNSQNVNQFFLDLNGNELDVVDTNNDGEIQVSEALQVSEINVNFNSEISSLVGVEAFANLRVLKCGSLNYLTSIDVSQNLYLERLECFGTAISEIDVSQNINLVHLGVSSSPNLTELDVSQNVNLEELICFSSQISELDLTQNVNLEWLYSNNTDLTTLDLSQNINLRLLWLRNNDLNSINFGTISNLTSVFLDNNNLTDLDLSLNANLNYLLCDRNQLSSLDVSQNINLISLECDRNNLTSLSLGANTLLEELICYENLIEILDVSQCTSLIELECNDNEIEELDISNSPMLNNLVCYRNNLTTLNANENSSLFELRCYTNPLETLYIKNGSIEGNLTIGNMASLEFICVDPGQLNQVAASVPSEVIVSTDCSYTVSVDEYQLKNKIKVFPNPVNSFLEIVTETDMQYLDIYDVHGRKVMSKSLFHNQRETKLNMLQLTTGIYFLNIYSEYGRHTERIVKN